MAVVYISLFELGQKEFLSINVGTFLQVPLLSCTYISDGMGYMSVCILLQLQSEEIFEGNVLTTHEGLKDFTHGKRVDLRN